MVNAVDENKAGTIDFEQDLGQTVRGLSSGQVVFSRYALKRILGRGGMGVVWLARDIKLDREVALKFVPEMLFLDAAARDDLKRETRRSLELTHPNIVRIYDFMEDEHAAAISMEYVDGPTLSQLRVEQNARVFEPAEIEPWLGGLCAALDYAHATARMVHRDLKPANLMLNAKGMVKITDFGIACSLMGSVARVSVFSSSSGTITYMSPQQMLGDTPSHLDDIYALGATLYELLTGKPPFHMGNIALQVREMEVESIAARRAKLGVEGGPIPRVWEETIAACLAKEPAARPQTAGEIYERLISDGQAAPYESTMPTMRSQQTMQGVPASPVSTKRGKESAPELVQRLITEFPGRTVAAAGIAALVLCLVVLAHFFSRPQREQVAPAVAPISHPAPVAATTPGPTVSLGTPVPAPTGHGGLMIKTVPAGAMVQLGGEALETSPAIFKGINAGKYPVRIICPDYEVAEMQVEIKPDDFTDLGTISLVRSTGSVQLSTTPEGSIYELKEDAQGGAFRSGTTPDLAANLPTGSYTLALQHPGWPDQVRHIQVSRGKVLPVDWQFPCGTLAVTSSPAGARVYLGERLLGVTPLSEQMPPGDYKGLQVVMDGMVPAMLDASVKAGQTATVSAAALEPIITTLQLATEPAGIGFAISGTAGEVRTGLTPASIYDLPAGDYTVTFSRAGWADFTAPAHLDPAAPVAISHDFPEGTVAITSDPAGAAIFYKDAQVGVTPCTVSLPPGDAEVTAKLGELPERRHVVTVVDGEETNLAFNMKSGGSSSSGHHHHHVKKAPPSALAKLGDSIKSFFGGGASTTAKTR